MGLGVCGGHCSLVNITNQLFIMTDWGSTTDIEQLRNLNNELLTENTELRSNVETLRGEYIAAINELDRTNVKQKKSKQCEQDTSGNVLCGQGEENERQGVVATSTKAETVDCTHCCSFGFDLFPKWFALWTMCLHSFLCQLSLHCVDQVHVQEGPFCL